MATVKLSEEALLALFQSHPSFRDKLTWVVKLPGAWWLVRPAEHMVVLRINRINGDWGAYRAMLAANPHAPANLNRQKLPPSFGG